MDNITNGTKAEVKTIKRLTQRTLKPILDSGRN